LAAEDIFSVTVVPDKPSETHLDAEPLGPFISPHHCSGHDSMLRSNISARQTVAEVGSYGGIGPRTQMPVHLAFQPWTEGHVNDSSNAHLNRRLSNCYIEVGQRRKGSTNICLTLIYVASARLQSSTCYGSTR